MIGRLRGILLEKQAPHLLVEAYGVGYEIQAPMSTFYHLPELGNEVTLLTHFIVREDAQLLFGFHAQAERRLFRALIKVNGVGPKLALTILSGMEPEGFVRCIREDDTTRLVSIPGIGKKTAERLMIETRDALRGWEVDENSKFVEPLQNEQQRNIQDAISALTTLGYKPQDAKRAIESITQTDLNSEELIRLALKNRLNK